jgi:hypothetical protein
MSQEQSKWRSIAYQGKTSLEFMMLSARNAKILDGGNDGENIHVEWVTDSGETVIGIYQLMGWTLPPRTSKSKLEAEMWGVRGSENRPVDSN